MKINPVPPALATAYIAGSLGLLPVPAAHGVPEGKEKVDGACFYAIDEFTGREKPIKAGSQTMSDGSVNVSWGNDIRNFATPNFTCPATPPAPGASHPYVVMESTDLINPTTQKLLVANPADPMTEETKAGNLKEGVSSECTSLQGFTWKPLNAVVVAFAHDAEG